MYKHKYALQLEYEYLLNPFIQKLAMLKFPL